MDIEDEAWITYRKMFSDVYDIANYSTPLQSAVMHAGHRLLEKAFANNTKFSRVLEVGAGTGEHQKYIRHQFDEYTLTDMDEKPLQIAKSKLVGVNSSKLRFELQTGEKLNYPENTFDRVIATHVLEHIYQPHLAIKEWRRVLKNGGTLSILIPTDPGLAWRVSRHLGPRKNAMSQGIAYDYVMAREHVNPCNNLIALLRHYFPNAKESWWPLPIPSMDLNLFFAFNIAVVKRDQEK